VIASAADPAAEANRSLFYSKVVAGIVQLVSRASGGVISQLTPLVTTFDDSVAGTYSNIRGNQAANRSPIVNTKLGIVNFGSETGGGPGATKDYANIGGGLNNEASGDYSCVPGGQDCHATGPNSFACNGFSFATGDTAFACGGSDASGATAFSCNSAVPGASGDDSFACNTGTDASGVSSFAANNGCIAGGDYSAAFGDGGRAIGTAAFKCGDGCRADGYTSFATGNGCRSIGEGAFSSGNGGEANGDYSVIMNASTADGDYSLAHGYGAHTTRATQETHASGGPTGNYQTSKLVLRGQTPGAAINESVDLKFHGFASTAGTTEFALDNDKAYIIEVLAIAGGVQAGPTRVAKRFTGTISAKCAAATAAIVGTNVITGDGDAGAATWTLVASVTGAIVRFTFNTGVGAASDSDVTLKIEFTEVAF
jgi:hypothetical protein